MTALTFGLKAKDFRKMEIFESGSINGGFGENCRRALRVSTVWEDIVEVAHYMCSQFASTYDKDKQDIKCHLKVVITHKLIRINKVLGADLENLFYIEFHRGIF